MNRGQARSHPSDGMALAPTGLLAAMVPAFDLAPGREARALHRRRMARNAVAAGVAFGLLAGVLADSPPVRRARTADWPPAFHAPFEPFAPSRPPVNGGPTDADAVEEAARLATQVDGLDARRRERALRVARAQRLPAVLDALAELSSAARVPSQPPAAARPGNDARPGSRVAARAAARAPRPQVSVTALRWRNADIEIDCSAMSAVDATRAAHVAPPLGQREPARSHRAGADTGDRSGTASRQRASLVAAVDGWLAGLRRALPHVAVTASGMRLVPRDQGDELVFTVHVGDTAIAEEHDD